MKSRALLRYEDSGYLQSFPSLSSLQCFRFDECTTVPHHLSLLFFRSQENYINVYLMLVDGYQFKVFILFYFFYLLALCSFNTRGKKSTNINFFFFVVELIGKENRL